MPWSKDTIMRAPKDVLLENIIELLRRMGFRDYERVSSGKEWGIDIVAIRDDPIAGMEKLVIALHRKGLASSRDVNVFADLVSRYKADKGILISTAGFTKDARVLISKEYRGKIVPWDGKKLVSLFHNYGIEPPEELLNIPENTEESREKNPLKEFELDAPLLYDFSAQDVFERVANFASLKYPIKPAEMSIQTLSVALSTAYIFSWSVGESDERDRAVVFSDDEIVLRATEDKKLGVAVTKAMLNDSSSIRATERNIEVPISPSEAVLLLKERAARELGVAEGKISINERKKVYVPKFAKLHLKVGDNTAKATVNLETGEVQFDINPLPDEHFIRKTEGAVLKQTGEEVVERELRREKDRVKVSGKTLRFSFEASFNPYTGKILNFEALLSDEALKELFEKEYPEGTVLNLEKGRKVAVADVLLGDGIAVVEVDMTKGTYKVAKKLLSPEGVFNSGRKVMEANFPLRDLTMKSYRVLEHKYLELTLESPDGKAIVKMDGATGDVLDYLVEISQERARELVAEKYPGFEIISVEENETEYRVNAGSDRHLITVRLSRDGKLMEEVDRVLKEGLVKKMAMERARDIDEEARIDSISLDENWNVEFTGKTKVGTLVLHRATGEVLKEDVHFTERAIEEMYHGHLRKTFGEETLKTERLTHYKEGGYIHIKVAGREKLYYARIDTKTGEIISEDSAPIRGITAKLKQFQLENKYK
ncbi:restriction endonuclease [Thermococcus celer Vu 13 = JCM 8558]|uniref:Restriction endonuclease n=2 Tax=Thermococcus celer TaxID=2264 RepID=A0A218P1A4_THECE|nr:restriction endonuclease [Thermococcus celer]ASI98709.1 restriction endonuclease [Thermococcus celer Vu 13 = JCM 8558]